MVTETQPKIDVNVKIVEVPTGSISPNIYNPNQESLEDFELLVTSIKQDGFTLPVIVNDGSKDPALKNMIIDGEHRWRAANVLQMPTIPVLFKAMDQAEMRASTIRHNKARGHHDALMEANLLRELSQNGMTAEEMNEQLNIDPVELSVMLDNAVNYDDAKELGKMLEAEQLAELNGRGVTGESANIVAGRHATIEARTLTAEQDGKQAGNETGQNVRFELVYSGEQADFMRKMVGKYGSALNALKAVREYARRNVA